MTEDGLTSISRAYLGFLRYATLQTAILAYIAWFHSSLFSNVLYTWALDLVPLWVYAVTWSGLTVLGFTASTMAWRLGSVPTAALVVWSAGYAISQAMFALSIGILTIEGSHGALAGSLQWGGLAAVAWLWLRHHD